jgi:hypothetical protein
MSHLPTPEQLVEQAKKARAEVVRIVDDAEAMVVVSGEWLADYHRNKIPLATEIIQLDEQRPADVKA